MDGRRFPKQARIFEVGPRDGLQNEPHFIATEHKVNLTNLLVEAGCQQIEVTSFVHSKWVPQLADAEEVLARVPRRPGVLYNALIPNVKGLVERSALRNDGGVWRPAEEVERFIPQSIQIALGKRLAGLSEDARTALTLAAVLGREFVRALDGFLRFDCEFVPTNCHLLPHCHSERSERTSAVCR